MAQRCAMARGGMSEARRSLRARQSRVVVWAKARVAPCPPRIGRRHTQWWARYRFAHPTISDTPSHSRGESRARGLQTTSLEKGEGAGKAGRSIAPAASRAMKKAHEQVTTGPPKQSGLPCAMVYGLFRDLPGETGLFCHRHRRDAKKHRRQLSTYVGAPGPHGFAVRIGIVRRMMPPRPSHPAPRS